jgi:hypothetical protein
LEEFATSDYSRPEDYFHSTQSSASLLQVDLDTEGTFMTEEVVQEQNEEEQFEEEETTPEDEEDDEDEDEDEDEEDDEGQYDLDGADYDE